MRNCGYCHKCGTKLKLCLDGEEWCFKCKEYKRYYSHGWSFNLADEKNFECPTIIREK